MKNKVSFIDFSEGMTYEERNTVFQILGSFTALTKDEFINKLNMLDLEESRLVEDICSSVLSRENKIENRKLSLGAFITVLALLLIAFNIIL